MRGHHRRRLRWQVLRRDHADFHGYGIAQQGCEWVSFFDAAINRAATERMVRGGSILREAARHHARTGQRLRHDQRQ